MFMDEFISFLTYRHQLLRDNILSAFLNEQWLVLHGAKGTGKSTLARSVEAVWPHRVLTLAPVNRKGYRWEWQIIADTQKEGCLTGRSFSGETIWSELLGLITVKACDKPLFILEDGHRVTTGITTTVKAFIAIMPKARLLMTGRYSFRQQRQLRTMHPLWFAVPTPNIEDYRRVIASCTETEQDGKDALPETFIRHIMKRCRGNLHLAARVGWNLTRNKPKQGEQQTSITPLQQREALRCLPAPRRTGGTGLAVVIIAALCGSAGWHFSPLLDRWLPPISSIWPAGPSSTASLSSTTLTSTIMSTNESLARLYSVWGYEVNKGEAWCDQAYRAGLVCLSGTDTLESLLAQQLPWIATLKVDNTLIPVVVIGESNQTITALSGVGTWIMDKAWFSEVWQGNYTLMWKPSPDGNVSIMKKSSVDDILWLDTMLSRVLNVEAENSGEWSPLLTEKVRQFQTQNKIKADGVVGRLTLIRLWQALDESPKLMHDGGKA